MAHLDLEEQEQLDQIKHFWKQYGGLITWGLLVLMAVYAGWNGWQYWQRHQAAQAAALYEEVERIAATGDGARLDRALTDMRDKFGSTLQAQQASLLAARIHSLAGRSDAARAALQWLADHASDEGYRALARLRLAGLLIDVKSYDEAFKQLSGNFPAEFAALVADRRGDVLMAQGHKKEAGEQYMNAWQLLAEGSSYRRIVDVKLATLGLAPASGSSVQVGEKK